MSLTVSLNSTGSTNFDPSQDSGSNQAQITQVLAQLEQILQAVFAALKQASAADGTQPAGDGNGGGMPSIRLASGDGGSNDGTPLSFSLNGPSSNDAPPAGSAPPANASIPPGGQSDGQTHGQSGSTLPANTGGSAAHAIADDLRSRYGLNDTQIAGVLGNLQQESGLKPNVNQGGAEGAPSGNFADDNANGWGLAQWGGTRKQGEIAYAQQHNLDPGSLDANIGYMNQELDGPYSKTISDLKNTTNVSQAAQVWDTDYEQATDPQMDNRLQYAQNFLNEGL
ncbi:phage tail tip lysozyme [Burkholderia sp. AU15512]|uniref:phage tail tip lysozyme n=1 Tax=Burkholderia sp. AU15512 TaxID=2015345 RepID=UPI00211AFD93|nr:phage tail tip lysozyme [Burkholderia sp. AU15512]